MDAGPSQAAFSVITGTQSQDKQEHTETDCDLVKFWTENLTLQNAALGHYTTASPNF
jgi:hypothetical protein